MTSKHKNLHADKTTKGNFRKKIEKPRRTSPRLQQRLFNGLSSLETAQELSSKYKGLTGARKQISGRESEKKLLLPPRDPTKAQLAKSARISVSTILDKPLPLTASNLKRHTLCEGYLDTFELINSVVDQACWSKGSERSATVVGSDTSSTSTYPEIL